MFTNNNNYYFKTRQTYTYLNYFILKNCSLCELHIIKQSSMCHRVWLCPELSVYAILHNSHNTIATTKDCSRQFDDDKECLLLAINFCDWEKIAILVLPFGEYTCWPTIREQKRILSANSIPVTCFLHRKSTGTDFSQLVLGSGNFTRNRWYLEPTRHHIFKPTTVLHLWPSIENWHHP